MSSLYRRDDHNDLPITINYIQHTFFFISLCAFIKSCAGRKAELKQLEGKAMFEALSRSLCFSF